MRKAAVRAGGHTGGGGRHRHFAAVGTTSDNSYSLAFVITLTPFLSRQTERREVFKAMSGAILLRSSVLSP